VRIVPIIVSVLVYIIIYSQCRVHERGASFLRSEATFLTIFFKSHFDMFRKIIKKTRFLKIKIIK